MFRNPKPKPPESTASRRPFSEGAVAASSRQAEDIIAEAAARKHVRVRSSRPIEGAPRLGFGRIVVSEI